VEITCGVVGKSLHLTGRLAQDREQATRGVVLVLHPATAPVERVGDLAGVVVPVLALRRHPQRLRGRRSARPGRIVKTHRPQRSRRRRQSAQEAPEWIAIVKELPPARERPRDLTPEEVALVVDVVQLVEDGAGARTRGVALDLFHVPARGGPAYPLT